MAAQDEARCGYRTAACRSIVARPPLHCMVVLALVDHPEVVDPIADFGADSTRV